MLIRETDIKVLSEKYKINNYNFFGGILYIQSNNITWIVEDNYNYITLKFQDKRKNKTRLHVRNNYKDLESVLKEICTTNKKKQNRVIKLSRLEFLFNQIANNQ